MSITISCFDCNSVEKIEINPYENYYENNQMNENNINQKINEFINENDSNINNWVCIDCVDKFQKQYEKLISNKITEKENFVKGLKNLLIDLHDEKLEQYLKKDSNKLEKENIEKSKEYKELREKEKEYKNKIEALKNELLKLEKENNDLNDLEKELNFIKQNEENIIKISSLNELYKIENKECTLNKNSFISYNNRDGLNKGMNDLIYLTEIISSTLNFSTKKYSLYSGFMGPKILNREEKKLYLLHIRNNDSSSKMLFLDGIEQYKSYLSELLSYINSKYNIGDLSYSPNKLKCINGFENLDISQSSIEEAIHFLHSILTHKKLKEYFNYEQI